MSSYNFMPSATKMALLRLLETIESEYQIDIGRLALEWDDDTREAKLNVYHKLTPQYITITIDSPEPKINITPPGIWHHTAEGIIPNDESEIRGDTTPVLPEGRGCVRPPFEGRLEDIAAQIVSSFDAHQDVEEPMTLGEAKALGHLVDHGHPSGECCEEDDCYQAWEMYPDG